MKVAIVYDKVNKFGGAERILLALHKLFPDAPLFTSVYDKKRAGWAEVFEIKTSFLQKIPFASTNNELIAPLMPLAFESFDFDEYDLVISVTSEAAKGIITKPHTKHICYCLTPTRYLWSGYEEYFKNKIFKLLSKPIILNLKKWDLVAAERPDEFVAISEEVQRRIKKYYGRESKLVYPSIVFENSKFGNRKSTLVKNSRHIVPSVNYFLIVSRLSKFAKYKRIDLAINACNSLGLPLKIVGDGSLKNELSNIAGPTVEFVGNINDEELKNYYKSCQALIFPGFEDLGLTMIEAQSMGKPVIAYGRGGALELVREGKTGIFFKEQSVISLQRALMKFKKFRFEPSDSIENAQRFNFEKFRSNFLSVVNQ